MELLFISCSSGIIPTSTYFFFSSRRRHTRSKRDWSSDVCSSDLVHQSAIGVIDDHDFLGAEQIVRNDQGAQRVISDEAAGVADDVRVSLFQSQGAGRKTGIHTGEDG